MQNCCYCLALPKGVRLIGLFTFLASLAAFVAYLVFIEDFRRHVLQDFYEIAPCTTPSVDIVVDSLFEYSLLANLLLVLMCAGCTRWLLMPWLIMYSINIVVLLVISVLLFLYPLPLLPESRAEYPILRCLGLVPLTMAIAFSYCWMAVKSLFNDMSSPEKRDTVEPCCPMQLKTGVQIIAGTLTIISAVILVMHYAKLDDMIDDKYERIFKQRPGWILQVVVSSLIIVAIVANLLVIVGCSGNRWRRVLLLPWLILYGLGVLVAIVAHQWLTTLCWVEEKIYGLVALAIGFVTLVIWTLVWIVAAEAAEKPKTLIGANPLGFQRL